MPERARYAYRADVLEQLLQHGVRPGPETRPELAHEFVSELYRHELRRRRDRLLRREFPKHEYVDRVVALRRRYWVLSSRPRQWLT